MANPTTRPRVVARRGASAYATENTIAAFELAREQGADMLEPKRLDAGRWFRQVSDVTLRPLPRRTSPRPALAAGPPAQSGPGTGCRW